MTPLDLSEIKARLEYYKNPVINCVEADVYVQDIAALVEALDYAELGRKLAHDEASRRLNGWSKANGERDAALDENAALKKDRDAVQKQWFDLHNQNQKYKAALEEIASMCDPNYGDLPSIAEEALK